MKCFPFCILLVFITACKKDLKTKDLSDTKWIITSKLTSSNIETWYYPAMQKCEIDDVFEFKSGGTLSRTDAGETCTPSTTSNTSWSVDRGRLYIAGGQWHVETHSDNELIVKSNNGSRVTYKRH